MRAALSIGPLLLLLMLSAALPAAPLEDDTEQHIRKGLAGVLGALQKLPGWSAPGPPVFYNEGNLYQYIDGQCELYFSYDFRQLASQELASSADADYTVVADLYDMAALDNAFGVYSVGRTINANFVGAGAQGMWAPGELRFWKDRYFCLLTALPTEKGTKADLLAIAQAVAGAIPGKVTRPALLPYFPQEGAVANSARYFLKDVLGQAFLSDGMSVTYKKGETSYRLFLCRFPDTRAAEEALSKLSQDFDGPKWHPDVYSPFPPSAFSVKDEYYGTFFAAPADRFLVIGVNLPSGSSGAHQQAARNLQQLYREVIKQQGLPSETAGTSATSEEP